MRLLGWFLLPVTAFSQPQPHVQCQVQPATSGVKLSTSSQLVLEGVSVKDKKGKIIKSLKSEDFPVTEDGKPQRIALFEFEDIDKAAQSAPASTPLPAPEIESQLTRNSIAPERPGEFRYKDRRLLVLYFDRKFMTVPDQLHAFDAAQKFIRTQMSPADMMAIIEYGSADIQVLQDFTGDRVRLQSIVATLIAGEAANTGDSPPGASPSDPGAPLVEFETEFNVFNSDRKLADLQRTAQMLGALNEKKSLLYFTGGLRLNGIDNQAQLLATTNAAVRSGVSFWPIDARGPVALPPLRDATQGSQGNAGTDEGAAALAVAANFERSRDTLDMLAADTGGKTMVGSSDLVAGMVAAEKAVTGYYIVGFWATNSQFDGTYRRIKITLKHDSGVKLDYRQGFFADKTFGRFTEADKERWLEDLLQMGDPLTELTMALEVNYFRQNRAEYFTPITVKIPGIELWQARVRGGEHVLIDFIGEIKDAHGTTVQKIRGSRDIKLAGITASELAKRTIEYDTGYSLPPGAYQIKVLARNSATGKIGTFLGKFTIPNLDRETQRIPITSVVLSSQRTPLPEAIAAAGNAKEAAVAQTENPLVQNGQKLIPSVTRVFHSTSEMYVYLQAYLPDAKATAQPLLLSVTFFQGLTKVMETPPVPVNETLNPKSHMVPMGLSVPLSTMRPGVYDCEVTVLDPAGRKAAFWQAPVMVIP